jgi:hypothetical protein
MKKGGLMMGPKWSFKILSNLRDQTKRNPSKRNSDLGQRSRPLAIIISFCLNFAGLVCALFK